MRNSRKGVRYRQQEIELFAPPELPPLVFIRLTLGDERPIIHDGLFVKDVEEPGVYLVAFDVADVERV